MVDRLDYLIREDYVKELKWKSAQLRYLRSQINPHFLYNCLFSLYGMIQNGDLENASEMAVYLGKNYQRSAHFNQKELTIQEEIDNIAIYARIMSIRFPGRMRLITEIDEETRHMMIPVLSLQTVVENALLHGMEGSMGECMVTISTHIERETLTLCVSDTGVGIDPQQMRRIQERLHHPVEIEDKHGLENVYMRLKLMCGEAVRMTVEDNQPSGTVVRIHIPIAQDASQEKRGGAHVQSAVGR
jgi:two-component system sensor histidine kinase YesM